MNMVADPRDPASVYMSWTENLPFGFSSKGDEGKIHISKLEIHANQPTVLKDDKVFDGFVVAGGIDITEDGVVGTLCAKYLESWMKDYYSAKDPSPGDAPYGPLLLAVCEVNTETMTKNTPWRMGRIFTTEKTSAQWGNYPHSYWYSRNVAGNGYLVYSQKPQMWTSLYGATVGKHTGYAMHSYRKDAPVVPPEYGKMPDGVENRLEDESPDDRDFTWGRKGVGDHTAGAVMRYNPILGELYLQKHQKKCFTQQQYSNTASRMSRVHT